MDSLLEEEEPALNKEETEYKANLATFMDLGLNGDYENMDNTQKGFVDAIRLQGENIVRAKASVEKKRVGKERFNRVVESATGDAELQKALLKEELDRPEEPSPHSLEELAAEGVVNSIVDYDKEWLDKQLLSSANQGQDVFKDMEDFLTAKAISDQFQMKIQKKLSDEGATGIISDLMSMVLIPYYAEFKNFGNIEGYKRDFSEPGQDLINQAMHLRKKIGDNEGYEQALQEAFDEVYSVYGNNLMAMATFDDILNPPQSEVSKNFRTFLTHIGNAADTLGVAGIIFGGVRGLGRTYKLLGSGKMSHNANVDVIVKARQSEEAAKSKVADEALEDTIPSAASIEPDPQFKDTTVLDEVDELLEAIETETTSERMIDYGKAIERTKSDLIEDNPNLAFQNFNVEVDPITNLRTVTAHMTKDGGFPDPFDFPDLKNYAEDVLGLEKQDYKAIDLGNNNWAIEVRKDVVEDVMFDLVPFETVGSGPAWLKKVNSYIWGSDTQMDEMSKAYAHLSDNTQEAIHSRFTEIFGVFDRSSKKNMNVLGKLLKKSITELNPKTKQQGIWLSEVELRANIHNFGKKVTQAEEDEVVNLYQVYRKLQDTEYKIRESFTRSTLATHGWESWTVKGLDNTKIVAKKITDGVPAGVKRSMVEGFPEGLDIDSVNTFIRSGRYTLLRVAGEEAGKLFRLVPTSQVLSKPLQVGQTLGYTQGPHRMYKSKYFLKRGNILSVDKEGRAFLGRDRTLFAFEDAEEANAFSMILNSVSKAIRSGETGDIKAVSKGWFNDIEEAKSFFKEKGLDKVNGEYNHMDIPFEVVDEGAQTNWKATLVQRGLGVNTYRSDDDTLIKALDWYAPQGRAFTSRRGAFLETMERLPDGTVIGPKEAPTLDPLAIMQKAVQNVSKIKGTENYVRGQVNRWNAQFGLLVDNPSGNVKHDFLNGVLKGDAEQVAQAEVIRKNIKRFMNTPDVFDRNLQMVKSAFIKRVIKSRKWSPEAELTLRNIEDKSVSSMLRTIGYDVVLGIGDMSQIFVQTQTAVAAIMMHPKLGAKASSWVPALWDVDNMRSAEALALVSKRMAGATDVDKDFFKGMVETLQKHRFTQIGGTMAELSSEYTFNVGSSFDKIVRMGHSGSRYLVYKAEKVNRIVAYGVAYQELFNRLGKAPSSVAEVAELSVLVDKYAINMRKSSRSFWQRGLLSAGTQFFSHQFRVGEALLGLNKSFTTKERLALGLGSMALYGDGGIPFGEQLADASEYFFEDTEVPVQKIRKGMIDGLSQEYLGSDAATRSRLGTFAQGFVFESLFDDNKSIDEKLAGPGYTFLKKTGEITVNSASDVLELALYSSEYMNRDLGDIGKDAVKDLLNLTSHGSRMFKAYYSYVYGMERTRNGVVVDLHDEEEIDKAVARYLGFPLEKEKAMYNLITSERDRQTLIKDTTRMLAPMANQLLMPGRSYEQVNQTMDRIKMILAPLQRDEPRVYESIRSNLSAQENTTLDKLLNSLPLTGLTPVEEGNLQTIQDMETN